MKNQFKPKLSSLTLPWPVNWDELFGVSRPLIVEVGFGRGGYLLNLAETNPDANVVGLEISNQSLVKVESAVAKRGLDNLCVIHSTAETAMHHLFEPATIQQIHINFPDPWFKSGHSHRRLMKRATVDVMTSRLAAGGLFYLATDILPYAEMSAELLAHTPGLENTQPQPWLTAVPGRFVTKYEAKARREGRACYYFVYRRCHTPVAHPPVIKDFEMPHIVLNMPLIFDDVIAHFQPIEKAYGDVRVSLLEVYQGGHSLLFDVYIKEPTIDQRVAIKLVKRADASEFTLKLGSIGSPRPTDGVHRAVALIAAWLTDLHPDVKILKNTTRD